MGYRRHDTTYRQQITDGAGTRVRNERRDLSKGRGVVLFLVLAQFACAAPGPSSAGSEGQPTILRVGVPEGNVPGEDLGVGVFVNILNYESLTLNGTDGRAVPRLAEKWRWTDNDLTLRIDLRRSVFLHDNRPFTGQTAADLVREAVTRERNLARYPSFTDIDTVTALSDFELAIRLKRPSAMLPEDLTVPIGDGQDNAGTGPFRTVSRDSEVVLEGFDRYYLGEPKIDRVIVRSFEAMRTGWASLLRGELDMLYDVPADAIDFVRNDDVDVIAVPRWYQYHLAFNSLDGPLKSPNVRKALNLAVDRAGIVERVLYGAGEVSAGPLYPKYWAYDAAVPQYQHDPAGAAALLDAAGYPLPKAASAGGPRARFKFTCLLPQNFAVWERVALEIQRDLFNVGVDMQFKSVPFKEFNAKVSEGDFEGVLLDMISGPTPARAYIWWRSAHRFKGAYNVFGYENPEAERLFEVLLRSTNDAAVRSATSKLQRVLHEDPPAIFVAWSTRTRAIDKRFLRPNSHRDPMLTMSQWTVGPQARSGSR